MIEEIRIKNFQAHSKVKHLLSPVTTFVGRSDKGKSAILRALRWVVTNNPKGTSFVKEGETDCKVGVKVDGRVVLRSRTKSKNSYSLDGEELKAFGAGTPDVVDEVFKISPASFQGQFDGPFWLQLSGGQLADKLNQIADLQLLTKMVSSAGKKVKGSKAELNAYRSVVENAKLEADFHEWAVDAKKELEHLDALEAQYKQNAEAHSKLQQLLHSVQDAQITLSNPSVADAIKAAETLRDAAQRVQQLQRAVYAVQDANTVLQKPDVQPAMDDLDEILLYSEKVEDLRALLSQLKQSVNVLEQLKKTESELQKQHSSIKLCPTCKQPLSSKSTK